MDISVLIVRGFIKIIFIVEQMLFQGRTVTSKWGKMLFQSGAVSYFKIGYNTCKGYLQSH